jgi:hypothetical protein
MEAGPQDLPVCRLGWGDLVDDELVVLQPMQLREYQRVVRSIIPLGDDDNAATTGDDPRGK